MPEGQKFMSALTEGKKMGLEPSTGKKWDMQADVVVVGYGAAGAATAITAHDLGAKVLILEKAPEGKEGGNTRVAAQGYLNTSSAEQAAAYLTALVRAVHRSRRNDPCLGR